MNHFPAASMGQNSKEHTKIWSAKIDSFDAYVFVKQNITEESLKC